MMNVQADLPKKIFFILIATGCLVPGVTAAVALAAGIAFTFFWGNPFADRVSGIARRLLALSIIGLGAGMNLAAVATVGVQGFGYTFISIFLTLGTGVLLGRYLKSESMVSFLISVGTAICGGSAIAALAAALGSKPHATSVALGVVFALNAVALLIFPGIGHFLELSQHQFGLWCALAVHDTSSVIGATMGYGPEALQTGTTVKLARALWIVPITLAAGSLYGRGAEDKIRYPWFIIGFLLTAAVVTWFPAAREGGHLIETAAKRALVTTLFLIGSTLSSAALKEVGVRPLVQGVLLWGLAATATLGAVMAGWVR